MGMARYVVYVSQKIEKNYPIDIIKYLAVILIIALTIFVLVKLFKINKIKLAVLTLLSSSLFVGFTMAKLQGDFT